MSINNELFNSAAPVYRDMVEVPGILNTHTHPRDLDADNDGRAEMIIPLLAEVYEDAIGMGNTKRALINSERARVKGKQWGGLIPAGRPLRIHVAGIMTEDADPEDIVRGYDKPAGEEDFLVMKMFIRAASNSSGADVDDMTTVIPALKAMTHTRFVHKKRPMTLMIHAERKYNILKQRISFLGRERAAIERDLPYLLKEVPEAHIVICHVSDAATIDAIRYYRSRGYRIWGEICPQYTIWTCDDLFEGPGDKTMFNNHLFCLPIFKTEADRRAILGAMLSGEDCWIFGTDEACHIADPLKDEGVKINALGYTVGGQTQIPRANVSYVIEQFLAAGKDHFLAKFLSYNGREAVGLPPSRTRIAFKRYDWSVEETLQRTSPVVGTITAHVAMAGQLRHYMPASTLTV